MHRRMVLCAIVLLSAASIGAAQQVADVEYHPPIRRPAYEAGKGPHVLIDEAHHNFHTSEGRYRPFAELLRRDGYRVGGLGKGCADSLKGVDVLVIANALNERNVEEWSLPTPSAFTSCEISAVRTWVETGGSLFLIADHMPFPGGASELAGAFGVSFSNGYARPGHRQPGQGQDVFEAATGLKDCAVTRGRSDDERVTQVATFGGSAFQAPESATPVLVFGSDSVSFETTKAPGITPDSPQVAIEGWCQGALMKVGNGRVAVFGEAAMFSAQRFGPEQQGRMGMNHPEAKQNHQLLLNVLHWLTRAEGMPD